MADDEPELAFILAMAAHVDQLGAELHDMRVSAERKQEIRLELRGLYDALIETSRDQGTDPAM